MPEQETKVVVPSGMAPQEADKAAGADNKDKARKSRRSVSLSPWAWGLGILIAVGALTVTQVPRLSAVATQAKGSAAVTPADTPSLSGRVYTQLMVGGHDFSGADLRGVLLLHLDLRGKSFARADVAGAVFEGSFLNGADLSYADLRGADLRDTCLRGADLAGAELAGADFTGADVTGATVSPAAAAQAIAWGSAASPSVCPAG